MTVKAGPGNDTHPCQYTSPNDASITTGNLYNFKYGAEDRLFYIGEGNDNFIADINECKSLGMKLLTPDSEQSSNLFQPIMQEILKISSQIYCNNVLEYCNDLPTTERLTNIGISRAPGSLNDWKNIYTGETPKYTNWSPDIEIFMDNPTQSTATVQIDRQGYWRSREQFLTDIANVW